MITNYVLTSIGATWLADGRIQIRLKSAQERKREKMEKRIQGNQTRSLAAQFQTREENEELFIEGYFAVFNSNYEIYPGCTESVAADAFNKTISDDVRALTDHDTRLVLGRTKAGTLELKVDNRGLWGKVRINPKDSEAMNLYERVKRGDVDQCSFGFDIVSEDTEYREDGSIHYTIREVKLYEVSVCTFPAYEETGVSARAAEAKRIMEERKERQRNAWREKLLIRLKGEH